MTHGVKIPSRLKNFLYKLQLADLPRKKQIITLAKTISQIPWGAARTTEDVPSQNKGTCTGKHKLLQDSLTVLDSFYSNCMYI